MGATISRSVFHRNRTTSSSSSTLSSSSASSVRYGSGPERPTLALHQLRSLDIILMSSRTFLLGIPVRDEMARNMANRIQSLHLAPQIDLDRWDRVGLISISDKAMEDGVTYDTVSVILATAYGVRSVTLREVMDQCNEVCIRPTFFPGEPSKRPPTVTPHPMRKANVVGSTFAAQQHRRTLSGIKFSNEYSLPLADDSKDPLNAVAHGDPRHVRRRQLHARLHQYLQPLLGRSFTEARVQVELAPLLQWLATQLLAVHVQPEHQAHMEAAVTAYAARRAALRNEAEQCAASVRQRLRARLREGDLITEYMRGIVAADVGFDPQAERDKVLEEVRREREEAGLAGDIGGTSAAMATKAVEERKKRDEAARRARLVNASAAGGVSGHRSRAAGGGRKHVSGRKGSNGSGNGVGRSRSSVQADDVNFEEENLELKDDDDDDDDSHDGHGDDDDDDDDDYDIINWSPDELQYVDLLGLFAHMVQSDASLKIVFSDEEVAHLVEMFLSSRSGQHSILASEFLRQWAASLERNAELSKHHGAIISAGFVCCALQHLGMLPGGRADASSGSSADGDAGALLSNYAAGQSQPPLAQSSAASEEALANLFLPSGFFQTSSAVQGAMTGALLGREHLLPMAPSQSMEVLDAEAQRLKELRAAALRAEAESAKREAEKRRKKEEWEKARAEQERKRRAMDAEARRKALADTLAKQIAADDAEKARAEEAARQEEIARFREQQMKEFEARRAKKRAEKEARQVCLESNQLKILYLNSCVVVFIIDSLLMFFGSIFTLSHPDPNTYRHSFAFFVFSFFLPRPTCLRWTACWTSRMTPRTRSRRPRPWPPPLPRAPRCSSRATATPPAAAKTTRATAEVARTVPARSPAPACAASTASAFSATAPPTPTPRPPPPPPLPPPPPRPPQRKRRSDSCWSSTARRTRPRWRSAAPRPRSWAVSAPCS